MSFEIFKEKRAPKGRFATVSVLTNGHLFINARCYRDFFSKCEFLNLLYDKENNILGIQPIKIPEIHSYSVSHGEGRDGTIISARSFLEYYNIDYKKKVIYIPTWNDKEKIIEVKLK